MPIVTKDLKVIGVKAAEHPNGFDLHAKSTRAQAQIDELNTLEFTLKEKPGGTGSDYEMPFRKSEHRKTPQEKAEQPSEFQCSFHFGYLNDKNKNESVPEKCFECPRSIDCMLSEFKKSQQSLEEIKKWY